MEVRLTVPFVTQRVPGWNNLCPHSVTGMIVGAYTGRVLTALDVVRDTGIDNDKPQLLSTVEWMCELYGVDSEIRKTPDAVAPWYRAMLDNGHPVIALCDYYYLPAPGDFAHYIVVVGYDDDGYIVHDPYQLPGKGDYWHITSAQFNAAISSRRHGNYPYQAMYPSEASLMAKPKGLGHNVQALFVSDFQRYLSELRDNPPPVMVCVESPARAQLIMQTLKPLGTDVIYREYDGAFQAQAAGFNWHSASLEQLEAHYATLPNNGITPRQRAVNFAMLGYDPDIEETVEQLARIVEVSKSFKALSDPKSDDNSQNNYTPAQWAIINEPYANMGFTTHANNEPNFNPETIEWLLAVAWICVQRGWRCVLGNWSVGTPPENEWHKADTLLRYVAQHRNLLSIGLHEYTAHTTLLEFGKITDPAQFPTVSPNTKPYLMGRFRWMLDYCKAQGFAAPNIVFTEFGFDTIHAVIEWQQTLPGYRHGAGYQVCKPAWQQWKPADWSIGRYAARMLGWVWKEIYQKHPEVKGAAFFTYDGAGAWHDNYRIVGETDFMAAIKQYEDFSVNTGTTDETFDRPTRLNDLVGTANFRVSPNGAVLGSLVRGDVFTSLGKAQKAGAYIWTWGTTEKYGEGWVATAKLDGTPVSWNMRLTP